MNGLWLVNKGLIMKSMMSLCRLGARWVSDGLRQAGCHWKCMANYYNLNKGATSTASWSSFELCWRHVRVPTFKGRSTPAQGLDPIQLQMVKIIFNLFE